jgi:hypothetical protein
MALSAEQQRLLSQVYATPEWKRATPKKRKALIEAAIVESGIRNLAYGDRDSQGFLQQRPSQGWPNVRDVPTATKSFLDRAERADRKGMSAGELAQAVQRSAFPSRYQQRSGEADAILGGTDGSPRAAAARTKASSSAVPDRRAAILAYAQNPHDPAALMSLAAGLTAPAPAPSTPSRSPEEGGTSKGGVAMFDGKPVASWIKPLLEYARERGWKGTVTSGYRSDEEQKRIYDSGVRPAAKPQSEGGGGSNHSRTGFLQGAVDVSDPETLNKILKAKGSRLRYAGAKDPVHFSVPRNGSY